MLNILFVRLNSSPTTAFTSRFVRFYHFLSSQPLPLGTDFFISVAEQVQKDVFVPLYLSVILPTTQTLTSPLTRKTAVVSLTRTLATSTAFAEKYKKGWAYTCEALLKLLQDPPVLQKTSRMDDMIDEQDVDDSGFGVGFTQLNTCRKPQRDFFPEIDDVKVWVSRTLRESDAADQMRISRFASERLSRDAGAVLAVYLRG
jgi:exportin-2 (importin alpha re-exporter)